MITTTTSGAPPEGTMGLDELEKIMNELKDRPKPQGLILISLVGLYYFNLIGM